MRSEIKILFILLTLLIVSCNHTIEATSSAGYYCEEPKYQEYFSELSNLDLIMYYDYEQGLRCAKAQNKPIFLTFTGHGAVACRETTFAYWLKDEYIFNILKNDYIIIALFVDDKSPLDSSDFYKSKISETKVTTIGQKNSDYQVSRYNKNSQPMSIVLDSNGDDLLEPLFYDGSYESILKYMQKGLVEFDKKPCKNNSIIIALVTSLMVCLIVILILLNFIKKKL